MGQAGGALSPVMVLDWRRDQRESFRRKAVTTFVESKADLNSRKGRRQYFDVERQAVRVQLAQWKGE